MLQIQFAHVAQLCREVNRYLTVFDLETTTLRGRPNFGITEVACFTVTPEGRGLSYSTLINPERLIDPEAARLTGITQEMVANQELWSARYAGHFDRMSRENHILSGFNIKTFDCPAVLEMNQRYGIETPPFRSVLDTRPAYRALAGVKDTKGKLSELAALFGVRPQGQLHRAQADVVLTVEFLDALIKTYGVMAVYQQCQPQTAAKGYYAKVDNPLELAQFALEQQQPSVAKLAVMLGQTEKEIVFALCRAVDEGITTAEFFAIPETRDWLRDALLDVNPDLLIAGKLKPIYEELANQCPQALAFDYLQLRVGLQDAGLDWVKGKKA